MKNVEKYSLEKCIFMTLGDLKELIEEITNGEVEVDYDLEDGIYFDGMYEYKVCAKLSEYFDVKITSIHNDNYSPIGIWISYK